MNWIVLCDAFIRISRGVWHWMQRAQRVSNPSLTKSVSPWGMSFRETTLTDYVVLRLLEKCAPAVRVFTFPAYLEAQTGADMELWITAKRQWLGLRVQCKIMSPDGTLKHLHYKNQNSLLIKTAQSIQGCIPIYLLYVGSNPHYERLHRRWYCCPWEPYWCPQGNWWLSAYRVRHIGQKKGRKRESLSSLAPFMWPWEDIVCHPKSPAQGVQAVFQRLRETVFRGEDDVQAEVAAEPPRYVRLAQEGKLPESVEELRALLEGREMRHLVILHIGES